MKYEYARMPSSTSPCSTVNRKRRFNSNDPKYRCCCSRCHVRTGAMFVGAAEMIIICLLMITASVLFVYDGYRNYPRTHGLEYEHHQAKFRLDYWSLIWLLAGLSLGLIVLITVPFLFAGIIRERRFLLWPHMVSQVVLLLLFGVLLVYSIIITIFAAEELVALADEEIMEGDDRRRKAIKRVVLYCLQTFACFVALIIFIAFFRVVYSCYGYLRDSDFYEKKSRYSAGSSPNATLNGRQTLIIETGGLLATVKR